MSINNSHGAEEALFDESQLKALYFASIPSALLSCIGSSTIIYLLWSDRNESSDSHREHGTYKRIMFASSCYDLLFSLGILVLKGWTIPEETGLSYAAVGNFTTCAVNGFFFNFCLGSMLYTASLVLYFVLKLNLNLQEDFIVRHIEPIFHILTNVITLGAAIFGICSDSFAPANDLPGACWFHDYPAQCEENKEVECIRGGDTHVIQRSLSVGVAGSSLLTVLVSMTLIVIHVYSTERKRGKYGLGTTSELKITREASIQALLFIGSFLLTNSVVFAGAFNELEETRENATFFFRTGMACWIILPLHGFWNAIIYIRPRYADLTKEGGRLSLVPVSTSNFLMNLQTCTMPKPAA